MERSTPPLMNSIMDAIGNTPMVDLRRIVRKSELKGRLLAKLEYLNPGFSKKDRIARQMMLDARTRGQLADGQAVVELTSGNTGTGLAIVCQALGHPFIAVMSRGNTIERARMMKALGAQVVLVDQASGSTPNQVSGADLALVEEKVHELVRTTGAFRVDQFRFHSNALAHERYTGPEIWEQSQGQVDVFVDYAGTGGTFAGVSRYLKSKNPAIRCCLVEPAGAAVLSGKASTNPSHKIQGGGYNLNQLPLLDRSTINGFLSVTDDEAIDATRILAREEGIFGGISSGANLAAAISLLRGHEQGATIVFLVCDSGLKYLSSDLYD